MFRFQQQQQQNVIIITFFFPSSPSIPINMSIDIHIHIHIINFNLAFLPSHRLPLYYSSHFFTPFPSLDFLLWLRFLSLVRFVNFFFYPFHSTEIELRALSFPFEPQSGVKQKGTKVTLELVETKFYLCWVWV